MHDEELERNKRTSSPTHAAFTTSSRRATDTMF